MGTTIENDGGRPRVGGILAFLAVLGLGVFLGIECFRARNDADETRALVQRLRSENEVLRHERTRYERLNEALDRKDPEAIRRALQKHGWIAPGRVVVLEEGR